MAKERRMYGGQPLYVMFMIFFIFLCYSGNGVVTPALNAMKQGLWIDIPASTITLISTLPSLSAIVGCLITGAVGGKYLTWKTTGLIAFGICLVFGLMPGVFHMTDFYQVLVIRAVWGIGGGMLWPLGNSMVLELYRGKESGNVLGWGQSCQSLGGVIMQLAGGYLASIEPQMCYYGYLIGLIGLTGVIALPPIPKTKTKGSSEKKEKVKIPGVCWVFVCLLFIGITLNTPLLVGNSTLMAERNFGDSFLSGIAGSLYTCGGILAGLLFGTDYKLCGRYIVPIAYLVMCLGTLIVILSPSALVMCIGMFTVAFGNVHARPGCYKIVGELVTPEQIAAMLGIGTALYNFGNFCGTFYIKLCNTVFFGGEEAAVHPMYVSAILYVAVAVSVGLFIRHLSKKDPDMAKAH